MFSSSEIRDTIFHSAVCHDSTTACIELASSMRPVMQCPIMLGQSVAGRVCITNSLTATL